MTPASPWCRGNVCRARLVGPLLAAALGCLVSLGSCGGDPVPEQPAPGRPASTTTGIHLLDATDASGLRHIHDNGASPERLLPETMGSGVALFDADGDGDPDLYLPNGHRLDAPDSRPPATARPAAFYRNRGDGTFEEAGRAAGFTEPFFALGTAVGDLDNDGDLDLFVSALAPDELDSADRGIVRDLRISDRLYLNRGDGTFEDVTRAFGLIGIEPGGSFGSSAAFVDIDRDGFLDLFVGRYVTWNRQNDVPCRPDGEHRSYCTPEIYQGQSNRLYRNVEGRRFEDVTAAAGLLQTSGKTLGVAVFDHHVPGEDTAGGNLGDGWPDLVVANDTWRNALYLNRGDGTFEDTAVELGVAYSLSGATRGAMGIDAGDLDGDGAAELVIGNFAHELAAVYHPTAAGVYRDDATQLGLGLPTLMSLTFGTLTVDLDNDSWLDVVFANGHIEPDVARFQPTQSYKQPLQVFRNLGAGCGFETVPDPGESGSSWSGPWVARGLASGDIDGDGDLDLVLTQNGGATRILRNDSPPRSWLRLHLHGTVSNRSAYGAVVTAVITDANGSERRLVRTLSSGRSYLSASEPIVHIGLGDLASVEQIAVNYLEIRWPSGQVQRLPTPSLNQVLSVQEPVADSGNSAEQNR